MRGFKKNLTLPILVAGLLVAVSAFASSIDRQYKDFKFPTQVMLEHQQWAGPLLADTAYLKSGQAASSTGTTTVTTFLHSSTPDFPRNITITTGGTTANIGAGTAVVTGTDFYGVSRTENFTISSTQNGSTTGSSAFATVTKVVFPAATGTGATFSVGIGAKLGLKRCTDVAGKYVFSIFDGAFETTRGTMVGTTAVIRSNTFTPNGTMDGAKVVDLYFIQDFSCSP